MIYTKLVDADIRKKQYLDSINYYYQNTKYKIVICNNTGDDFHGVFNYDSNRFEYLYFDGNNYNPTFGKGYGEFEIIKYALYHSRLISQCDNLIKVTGRLIIPNISEVITYTRSSLDLSPDFVLTRFKRNNRFAYSTCIVAPKLFFKYFVSQENVLNDSKGYYLETFLYDILQKKMFDHFTFLKPLIIIGVSGTHNTKFKNDYTAKMDQWQDIYYFLYNHQNDNNTLINKITRRIHLRIRMIKCIRKYILHRPLVKKE
jgi:hypothetical protein